MAGVAAAACAGRDRRGRAARDLRRWLQRQLHGARDLRRRRQHHPRRGREDRRRQGRHRRLGHADAAGQGRGRPEHHERRLQGLPLRRQLHGPPAGADRREVRRLPADPAARRRHAAAAAAEEDRAGARRLRPVPAAGAEHAQPGRRRPARRHQPPARTPAPDDHPQRTRRRPGRPRQRPARSASSAPTRRCRNSTRCSRSSRARTRCSRNSPSTPTRRWRRSPRCASSVADFIVQSNTVAQASARAPRRAGAQPRRLPAVPRDSSARRWNGSDASPTRRRPCSRTSTGRAGDQQGLHEPAGLLQQLDEVLRRTSGKTSKHSGPALRRQQAAARAPEDARHAAQAVLRQLRRSCSRACASTGGLERILDFIFLGAGRHQRLRLARALPARRRRRQDSCLTYAAHGVSPAAIAKLFSTGSARRQPPSAAHRPPTRPAS